MKPIEKTLEYHELIMTLDSFKDCQAVDLPYGYRLEFWSDSNCIDDWIRIHLETGEFASPKEADVIFHLYYDKFYSELSKRCFFILDSNDVKVATATISPTDEYGYPCALDWLAVSQRAQGKGIGKALIANCIDVAKGLGYDKMVLHTQTNTWLAAKLYLDFGFKPYVEDDIKGWQILKTLTNHRELSRFDSLNASELYDGLIINVENALSKIYETFNFSVWYKDGRNDVLVNADGEYKHYKFFDNGKTLKLVDKN